MIKNCRQRLFYHFEEPVVAVSSKSSRACIYSTRLAYLVISVTVLQPAILSNSSVGHARQCGNKINLAFSQGLKNLNLDNNFFQRILFPPLWYSVQAPCSDYCSRAQEMFGPDPGQGTRNRLKNESMVSSPSLCVWRFRADES